MTARCEKTSLVIAQFPQGADASFFFIVFIGKIAVQCEETQRQEKVRGTFLVKRRTIPRSGRAGFSI